ncbi:SGNH/GDSL hydrolase family protein [Modestobacter sp. VKM Ac-2979]|uniref:SGNH/GDSL hydrolase family protein n=1 Tax=unclassified Modestobacter TaxID=2643866 RepID=UPI0022AB6150|nr:MULTISPECIES: SGNH/GDSL hydrolase family protein [unclassified Modestobacter]MCZ2813152.1 SGNH/GDSL hydrolase family protein [Modestobacter sp. VKM Ac-2979]MCZ2842819.1 SGNH/GDSL hydrolase family protein [Modestobacter sp. VKM Ac-2980]
MGSWAAAMTPAGAADTVSGQGFTDTTLRQVAHLSVGGDSVRIRISNDYGTTPLVVSQVTVGPGAAGAAVDPQQLQTVTFEGSPSVTIPAGAEWVSDPVPLDVADDSDLVVSMYLPGPTGPATVHSLGRATSYQASGDATSSATEAFAPLDTSRYFLEGVDVTTAALGSVVFFGDSITDGYASSIDENLRYPDQVADRLLARPERRECGVLNAGISGNRVLTDAGTAGVSALARFEDDVIDQTAVRSVVLLEGINDIGRTAGALEPEELIAVYQQFIERAHDHGIRVIGATITPYEGAGYYSEDGEADRQAVNEWIRTSGEFDDVVDFDAAVRDPQNPSQIRPDFDPGDHLHPNDAGYAAMAATVDLKEICSR